VGIALTIAQLYVLPTAKKRELERLFRATADAFQAVKPPTDGLAFEATIRTYGEFTLENSDRWLNQGRTEDLRARLFANASRIGEEFRHRFSLDNVQDVMRMSRLIYRLIGIDFHGKTNGEVTVNRCFFTAFYSSDVCRLVSSLDEGLLSGLSGGGRLRFLSRITEGHRCCKAYLDTAGI
jgi:hypothetical protein